MSPGERFLTHDPTAVPVTVSAPVAIEIVPVLYQLVSFIVRCSASCQCQLYHKPVKSSTVSGISLLLQ